MPYRSINIVADVNLMVRGQHVDQPLEIAFAAL
jgi:hypothetical protein